MKKTIWWIIGIVGVIALVVGSYFLFHALNSPQEEDKDYAPDFTVTNSEGNPVSLSSLRGRPVVINFWATWCPYCLKEMPDFEAAYKAYGDDVVFMMINATGGDETMEKARAYIMSTEYTFPVYYDIVRSADNAYDLSSLPYTYFINADGTLNSYHRGMISAEELEEGILKIKQ